MATTKTNKQKLLFEKESSKHNNFNKIFEKKMLRKYSSVDRIDKENRRKPLEPSPYSIHYKSNLTHDQRELISHRQHVRKLHRNDLEDRYLELLDENFAIKKENTSNHDKIRKLVTKVLRLSSDDKRLRPCSSDATKSKLSNDENLKIKIIDLESYNAQLKERLNLVVRYVNSNKRSSSAATFRRPTSGLLKKTKMYKSQDEFLLNIALSRPDTQNSRILCFEDENNLKSAVAHYEDIPEAIENEKVNETKVEGKSDDVLSTLKLTIEQLQNDLIAEKENNQRLMHIRTDLEKEIREQVQNSNQFIKNDELDGLNERLRNYENEMSQLQKDCLNIKSISENELEDERTKLFELKAILDKEIDKNEKLQRQKEMLEEKVESINQLKQESTDIQAENDLLRKHRENISSLASELALRNETIKKLTKTNEELTSDLMDSKAQLQALNDIHHDLMNKIRDLQDMNDNLTIQIEGLKARCQCLMEQNTELNKKYHSVNVIIEV